MSKTSTLTPANVIYQPFAGNHRIVVTNDQGECLMLFEHPYITRLKRVARKVMAEWGFVPKGKISWKGKT